MTDALSSSSNFVIALSVYFLGVASPGPSNLSIMATAMNCGRKRALSMAAGVIVGSLVWGLLGAFGLSSVIARWSGALVVLKVLGGAFLLWLAFKVARAAASGTPQQNASGAGGMAASLTSYFLKGAMMHLANPKALMVWVSIVTVALPAGAKLADALSVVIGCTFIGILVFAFYALAFSTSVARKIYPRIWRWLEGLLAVVLGYAGIRTVLSEA